MLWRFGDGWETHTVFFHLTYNRCQRTQLTTSCGLRPPIESFSAHDAFWERESLRISSCQSTRAYFATQKATDNYKITLVRNFVCDWHVSHVQASPRIKIAQLDAAVDPLLEGRYPPDSMRVMAKVAVECVEQLSIDRPNMTQVANRLGALKTMQDQLARGQSSSVGQGSSVMLDHIPFSSEASGSDYVGMGGTGGADSRSRMFDSTQIGMGR